MENGNYFGTYIGKEMCGFKYGHNYQFEVSNNGRTYNIYAFMDNTDEKAVDLHIPYASEKSIRRNWNINEDDN